MADLKRHIRLIAAAGAAIALTWHWVDFFRTGWADSAKGERLVVFGPSSWDTLVPGATQEQLDKIVGQLDAAFRREHPEVGEIVHDSRGQVSDGVARLRNSYVAGNQVDVVVCAANPVNTSYARLGLIAPVDSLISRISDRFDPAAIANFEQEKKIWAAPLSAVNMSTFFYNKDLLKKVNGEVPKTLADFRSLAVKLRSVGTPAVVHQGKNAWMWTPWYFSSLVQTTGGNHLQFVEKLKSGNAHFTDSESLAALRSMRGWIDAGVLDPGSSQLDEEGMKAAFLGGRAAAFFGGTWDMPGIAKSAKFDWGVFQFPAIDNATGRPRSFGGAEMGLCLAKGSASPKLAEAYIEFLTRPENARRLFEPQSPFATSHPAIAGIPGEKADAFRRILPAEKPMEWLFTPEINEILQRELQAMMAGTQSPDQTAKNLEVRFRETWPKVSKRGSPGNA